MCENTIIPITSYLEMLDINIDEQLKFDNHQSEVSQKSVATQAHEKMSPFDIRHDLYLSFIVPHLNYCSETWHFCTTNKLEKIDERVIRFEFRDNNTKYEELLRQLCLSTLQNRRLVKIVTSVSKVMHSNNVLLCISGLISCRKVSYILRGNNRLILPKPKRTSYVLKLQSYLTAKLGNVIPDSLRRHSNFKVLKTTQKTDLVKFI